ncbi:MAG: class I SAM-dependent methyltransferase [Sphingobium sp.]|nr:class I SAM-dependent methyltransferase [Sphingobium sp.]
MTLHLLYGMPPVGLADVPVGAVQASPLVPGATLLDTVGAGSATSVTMVAPPGTIERRHALALALRSLRPGGTLVALGPKDKGGARIRRALEAFGCAVAEDSKNHWRICRALRPEAPQGLDEALAEGSPRFDVALDLWAQPGIFSWDRIDEGSALLLETLGPLSGHGADLGAGLGLLSRAVLSRNAEVTDIEAVELDARAIAAARRNVPDERVRLHWLDVREGLPFSGLDFVVMNPPFHTGGGDDVGLGRAFLQRAREALRPGGVLWMVANRHLPYEAELAALFKKVEAVTETGRFKVVRATA